VGVLMKSAEEEQLQGDRRGVFGPFRVAGA
jgi:hypothetical protein